MNTPQPPKNPNTPPPITPKGYDKKRAGIIIGLIALAIAVVVAVIVYKSSSHTGGGNNDDSSFNIAIWIPIWVAIWVPIMAAQKNKQGEKCQNKEMTDKHKKILIALVTGLTLAMVFGVIALIAQK